MIITHNGNIIMSDGFILNKVSSTPTPPSFADTKSFQFDGVTDRFIGVGNYSELDGQNKATFSFWIKPPSVISSIQVVSSVRINTSASNKQFQIQLYTSGLIALEQDSGSKYIRGNSSALNLGQWNHVLFCFDTTQGSSANRGRVFINGINETLATSVSGVFSTATGGLYIAENQNGQYDPFEGLLNEFSIWSGSDQRANVSEIWNGGLPNDLNTLPTAPQPTTWFRMGENAVWDGSKFVMTDVNGGYVNTSVGILPTDPNPTTDVPLFDNKSFTYDGVSDYVSLSSRTQNFTDFTISVWFKTQPKGGINSIIGNSGAEGGYLFFIGQSGGVIKFVDDAYRTISGVITDDVWHHLAVTYDSGANELKSYVDNVLFTTYTPVASTLPTNSHSFNQLGQRTSVGQWLGNINDLSVFSNVLSFSDVTAIFNGGVPNNISALSPIHYWRAEQVTFDGTDWTLIDQGSGGNNGTSVSMPLTARTSDVPLFDNKSFAYDGTIDYVDVGDVTSFSNTSTFTYSSWYKQTTLDVIAFMFGSYIDANNWIAIYTWSNGLHSVAIRKSGTNSYTSFDYSSVITAGQWFHFVAVYDGNLSGNDKVKLYFDGVLVTLSYIGTMPTSIGSGVNITNIGKADNFAQTWNGSINDVLSFNTALTQAQVTEIYNGGIANNISSLNPLSYWRSEFSTWDGSNWTMIDQGSGANNGTSVSMPLTSRTSDVPT